MQTSVDTQLAALLSLSQFSGQQGSLSAFERVLLALLSKGNPVNQQIIDSQLATILALKQFSGEQGSLSAYDRVLLALASINTLTEQQKALSGIPWTHTLETNPQTRPDGSPLVVGDRIWDTLYNQFFVWDGTRWLGSPMQVSSEIVSVTDTGTYCRVILPRNPLLNSIVQSNVFDVRRTFIERIGLYLFRQGGTVNSSNYWDIQVVRENGNDNTKENVGSVFTINSLVNGTGGTGAVVSQAVALPNSPRFHAAELNITRVGSPPTLRIRFEVALRIIRVAFG